MQVLLEAKVEFWTQEEGFCEKALYRLYKGMNVMIPILVGIRPDIKKQVNLERLLSPLIFRLLSSSSGQLETTVFVLQTPKKPEM